MTFERGLDRIALGAVAWSDRCVEVLEFSAGAPVIPDGLGCSRNFFLVEHRASLGSVDNNLRSGTDPPQQMQHVGSFHRDAAGGWRKIRTRQMEEHRAASACDTRRDIVIDFDNEVVELIVARKSIATLIAAELYRLIVMAAGRVFAPGVVRLDGANRQESFGLRVTVGAPP